MGTEREHLLASALDAVLAPVLVFDERGRVVFANRQGETAVPPDFARMWAGELTSPVVVQGVEWSFRKAAAPDGARPHLVCTGSPLRQEAHFLQTLIDTLPNPLFFKSVDGLYRGCNRAFEEMLGIPREKIVGKTVYDLSPKELADVYYEKDLELFRNPGTQVYEARVRHADGRVRDVIYYKATYDDAEGRLAGLVGIFLDITPRKEAERELAKARDELEERVRERTAELERLKNRAEAADGAKSEFLNIASHELRTPLTTLHLALYQARRLLEKGEAVGEDAFSRIDRQVSRLTRMVGDLLDVSRLERGVLVIRARPIELNALLQEAVEDFRGIAPSRAFELQRAEAPIRVIADPDRIRQVVTNLLDNALKYTPPESSVRVAVSCDPQAVRVTVADRGPGISVVDQQQLFTRFYRVQSALHQAGMGLGLYISREIIERHGGAMGVQSAPGEGASFWFELPV